MILVPDIAQEAFADVTSLDVPVSSAPFDSIIVGSHTIALHNINNLETVVGVIENGEKAFTLQLRPYAATCADIRGIDLYSVWKTYVMPGLRGLGITGQVYQSLVSHTNIGLVSSLHQISSMAAVWKKVASNNSGVYILDESTQRISVYQPGVHDAEVWSIHPDNTNSNIRLVLLNKSTV